MLGSLLNPMPATIGQLCWHTGSYCAPLSAWHPYTLPYNVLNPPNKEHSGVRFLPDMVKLDSVQPKPWPKSTPSPWAGRGGFLLNPQWSPPRWFFRNPDRDSKPWCYVFKAGKYTSEFCSTPACPKGKWQLPCAFPCSIPKGEASGTVNLTVFHTQKERSRLGDSFGCRVKRITRLHPHPACRPVP